MYAVIHIIDQGDNRLDILTKIKVQIAILILPRIISPIGFDMWDGTSLVVSLLKKAQAVSGRYSNYG